VGFGAGINGLPGTAAVFNGPALSALYIADTRRPGPFRIKTGSWGCWFRTAKRGLRSRLVSRERGRRRAVSCHVGGRNVAALI
jgi:hypothetical protein